VCTAHRELVLIGFSNSQHRLKVIKQDPRPLHTYFHTKIHFLHISYIFPHKNMENDKSLPNLFALITGYLYAVALQQSKKRNNR
jgi:hypothetical protein